MRGFFVVCDRFVRYDGKQHDKAGSHKNIRGRIRMYNAVNTPHGYREISIYSPLEVIEYED